MDEASRKKILEYSVLAVTVVLIVFALIINHEMQYVDDSDEPETVYASFTTTLNLGDDVPTKYNLVPDVGMTFVYAEVYVTNHHYNWIILDPQWWFLRCGDTYLHADQAKSVFLDNFKSIKLEVKNIPTKVMMLFQVPLGTDLEECCLVFNTDENIENKSCSRHLDHTRSLRAQDQPDGSFSYTLDEGYTFNGATQWDKPSSGKKYVIADIALANISGKYTISTNDWNFQLDVNGLRYNSSIDSSSAIGNNTVEVTKGHIGKTVIVFQVPENTSLSDCLLVWDDYWSIVES